MSRGALSQEDLVQIELDEAKRVAAEILHPEGVSSSLGYTYTFTGCFAEKVRYWAMVSRGARLDTPLGYEDVRWVLYGRRLIPREFIRGGVRGLFDLATQSVDLWLKDVLPRGNGPFEPLHLLVDRRESGLVLRLLRGFYVEVPDGPTTSR